MRIKVLILAILLGSGIQGSAQFFGLAYQRQIVLGEGEWQNIVLPDGMYAKVNADLSDLRIVGVGANGDTLEVPFVTEMNEVRQATERVKFQLINQNRFDGERYYTFKVPVGKQIGQIDLDFSRENFDWRIDLEASNDQKQWFKLLTGYRVVSIQNDFTSYSFSSLRFETVEYRYFRLRIRNEWFPFFKSASVLEEVGDRGKLKNQPLKSWTSWNDKSTKNTVLELELEEAVPVALLELGAEDKIDFIRPITVEYLIDSIETEKGWRKNYGTLMQGTFSSFEQNRYNFGQQISKNLRITVENNDNLPLTLRKPSVKSLVWELKARFPEKGNFFLCYGKAGAQAPVYDLQYFKNKIPNVLPTAELSDEKFFAPTTKTITEPPKWWLWAVMGVVGSLLVVFAIRMLRAEGKNETEKDSD